MVPRLYAPYIYKEFLFIGGIIMNISSKNIIGIKEFLANYLLNEKDAKNIESKMRNMSHDKMTLYLVIMCQIEYHLKE